VQAQESIAAFAGMTPENVSGTQAYQLQIASVSPEQGLSPADQLPASTFRMRVPGRPVGFNPAFL
jgi:hypothetical protein